MQVVREGNPGQRRIPDAVVFPPTRLREPDWADLLPGDDDGPRTVAAAVWRKTAPALVRSVGIVAEQQESLVDYCITWARIVQGERALAQEGVVLCDRERGPVTNRWTIILNQYRAHFRSLVAELGLSPSAVTRLRRPFDVDGADDPFD